MTTPPAIDHSGEDKVGLARAGGLLVVLPVIADFTADRCVPSLLAADSSAGFDPDDILVIDNSRDGWAHKYGLRTYRDPDGRNNGVARSWNIGAREVLERGLDYLVIMSASMLFGPMLHTTWVEQMERFWGENVIENTGNSHHLIAYHRRVIETVGLWDVNFHPGYFEADDHGYRMHMVGMMGGWSNAWVNAMSMGHAQHHPLIRCPAKPLIDYYAGKWGAEKGHEIYTLPWCDRALDYFEETPIPVLAERYGLGDYGVGWW